MYDTLSLSLYIYIYIYIYIYDIYIYYELVHVFSVISMADYQRQGHFTYIYI